MRKLILVCTMIFLAGCASSSVQPIVEAHPENGYGTMTLTDGSIYSGEIHDSLADGFGTITSKESIYTGVVKNGQPNGFGKTITHDGATYEGEHKNGEFHGRGMLTLSDGSVFIGYMKHNKVDKGTMNFTDGRSVPVI